MISRHLQIQHIITKETLQQKHSRKVSFTTYMPSSLPSCKQNKAVIHEIGQKSVSTSAQATARNITPSPKNCHRR